MILAEDGELPRAWGQVGPPKRRREISAVGAVVARQGLAGPKDGALNHDGVRRLGPGTRRYPGKAQQQAEEPARGDPIRSASDAHHPPSAPAGSKAARPLHGAKIPGLVLRGQASAGRDAELAR